MVSSFYNEILLPHGSFFYDVHLCIELYFVSESKNMVLVDTLRNPTITVQRMMYNSGTLSWFILYVMTIALLQHFAPIL